MMNFSEALYLLKEGHCVYRKGWNQTTLFIFLVEGSSFKVNRKPLDTILGNGAQVRYQPHIDARSGIDGSVYTWTATNADLLAEDWFDVN